VRDLEVAILELEKIAKNNHAQAAGVRKVANLHQVRLEEARAALQEGLELGSLLQLRDDFLKALETATTPKRQRQTEPLAPASTTPETYRQVARAVILLRLEEFEALSEGFRRPFKVKPLHNLRIGAKHLRYALELLWQCWADGQPDRPKSATDLLFFAAKVTKMQSSLGNLHDADVWIESLSDSSDTDLSAGDLELKEACFWLLRHFVKVRSKYLNDALMQWHEWETGSFSLRVREIVKEPQIVHAEYLQELDPASGDDQPT